MFLNPGTREECLAVVVTEPQAGVNEIACISIQAILDLLNRDVDIKCDASADFRPGEAGRIDITKKDRPLIEMWLKQGKVITLRKPQYGPYVFGAVTVDELHLTPEQAHWLEQWQESMILASNKRAAEREARRLAEEAAKTAREAKTLTKTERRKANTKKKQEERLIYREQA